MRPSSSSMKASYGLAINRTLKIRRVIKIGELRIFEVKLV